MHRRSGDCGNL